MQPTYTTKEVINMIRECNDLETAKALEYIVREERHRYLLMDLWRIRNQIIIRINEIKGEREWL